MTPIACMVRTGYGTSEYRYRPGQIINTHFAIRRNQMPSVLGGLTEEDVEYPQTAWIVVHRGSGLRAAIRRRKAEAVALCLALEAARTSETSNTQQPSPEDLAAWKPLAKTP